MERNINESKESQKKVELSAAEWQLVLDFLDVGFGESPHSETLEEGFRIREKIKKQL